MASRAEAKQPAPALVRDRLREAIFSGKLQPGEQLRQEELAERYGISRIPVREALRQLEAEGLVTHEPNKGAVVSALSLSEVLELLDIRIGLECRALTLAVPNMVDSDFAAAERLLKTYDKEPRPQKWGEMNWRFHETLYAPCDRPKLLALIEGNYGRVSRFVRAQVSIASGKEKPQREHYELLAACKANKADLAASLLEAHIMQTQKALMAVSRQKSRGR